MAKVASICSQHTHIKMLEDSTNCATHSARFLDERLEGLRPLHDTGIAAVNGKKLCLMHEDTRRKGERGER